jgi:hypothetical protein
MGNFYTNITVRHDDQAAVAALVTKLGRDAYVSRGDRGMIVVYDRESDEQPFLLEELASQLSSQLNCPVFAVINHDDDILIYLLFSRGEKLDHYASAPGYFEGTDAPPAGGEVAVLCAEFDSAAKHNDVSQVLRPTTGRVKDRYVFAFKQHEDLVRLLSLPPASVGLGYRYIAAGDLPPGIDPGAFVHISSAR